MNVRTRFAPSPTGDLHVGGVRTALFNWLWAKVQGGQFLLRVEDTDINRYSVHAEEQIVHELKWLGLLWDEGPQVGGDFGPYKQSDRLSIYKQYAYQLWEQKFAYPCFCTSEDLEKARQTVKTGYSGICRNLSSKQLQHHITQKTPFVLRLKIPINQTIEFEDYLRGSITYQSSELDDIVIFKSNGYPSYHLANVVDDHLMQISHVLRGEEWIPSTPKHILLYRYLGWKPPVFVHLPVILSANGGKLSKRSGSTSIADYRQQGILPPALINFLALLGWNPGDDREIMSIQELTKLFSLDRIGSKSAVWDSKKLEWMNSQYFGQLPTTYFLEKVKKMYDQASIIVPSIEYLEKVIGLIKGRCKKLDDFLLLGMYFFQETTDKPLLQQKLDESAIAILQALILDLKMLSDWQATLIEQAIHTVKHRLNLPGMGKIMQPVRLAISSQISGPSLYAVMELLGKTKVISRMKVVISTL